MVYLLIKIFIYGKKELKNYDDENTVGEIEKYFVCSNDINYLDIENMSVAFMAEQCNQYTIYPKEN